VALRTVHGKKEKRKTGCFYAFFAVFGRFWPFLAVLGVYFAVLAALKVLPSGKNGEAASGTFEKGLVLIFVGFGAIRGHIYHPQKGPFWAVFG
jgi:hypothetical protein